MDKELQEAVSALIDSVYAVSVDLYGGYYPTAYLLGEYIIIHSRSNDQSDQKFGYPAIYRADNLRNAWLRIKDELAKPENDGNDLDLWLEASGLEMVEFDDEYNYTP